MRAVTGVVEVVAIEGIVDDIAVAGIVEVRAAVLEVISIVRVVEVRAVAARDPPAVRGAVAHCLTSCTESDTLPAVLAEQGGRRGGDLTIGSNARTPYF